MITDAQTTAPAHVLAARLGYILDSLDYPWAAELDERLAAAIG